MPHTKWKQKFFGQVEPIAMVDPLAVALGAIDEGGPIYYSYQDCVKLAGHACASVSSAYMMTKLALKELYGDTLPVRGDIEVWLAGERDQGAIGPIGQVIQFITGAAIETGFKGLGGKFKRAGLFHYDEEVAVAPGVIGAVFRRLNTNAKVSVTANPSGIPLNEDEKEGAQHMAAAVHGGSPEDLDSFHRFWQGRNRKILLEDHPGVFVVTKIV